MAELLTELGQDTRGAATSLFAEARLQGMEAEARVAGHAIRVLKGPWTRILTVIWRRSEGHFTYLFTGQAWAAKHAQLSLNRDEALRLLAEEPGS